SRTQRTTGFRRAHLSFGRYEDRSNCRRHPHPPFLSSPRPTKSKEASMNDRPDSTLDRLGAVCGVLAVVLLFGRFTVVPALPSPNHGINEIARSARVNRDGLLFGAYIGALFTAAMLVFGACVSARLRRAEGAAGGWWLVSLVGTAALAAGIVGNALTITF